MNKVSVIMPAYNAETFIGQSIECVLAQTYPHWELWVVDDGSSDNTKGIVEGYADKDERVKYLYQENGKQGKARNLGLQHATGNYIAFLDSDDLWVTQKLELQVKQIEEKNVDLVFSNGWVFKDNEDLSFTEEFGVKTKLWAGKSAIRDFIEENRIPILTVLLKKGILDEVDLFEEREEVQNAEDYHLWLKLLKKGFVFYSVSQPLAKYRRHSASVTNTHLNLYPPRIEVLKSIDFEDEELEVFKNRNLLLLYKRFLRLLLKEKKEEKFSFFRRQLNNDDLISPFGKLILRFTYFFSHNLYCSLLSKLGR